MVFEKDFREFCSLLNEEKIDYLIVGGYAVAFQAVLRCAPLNHSIDERLERLTERHEALTLNVELLTRDVETLRAVVEKDGENIGALARIAEAH